MLKGSSSRYGSRFQWVTCLNISEHLHMTTDTRDVPVAVTGATGFVGLAVLDALTKAGIPARALVRDKQKLPERYRSNAVEVDLENASAVAEGVSGTNAVIHLAFDMRAPADQMNRVADRSTRNLISACAASGARLVLASSYSVVDWVRTKEVVSTASPTVALQGPFWYGNYAHAKAAQEALARQLCAELNVPLSIVRPSKVWDDRHLPRDVIGPKVGGVQLVVRPERQAQIVHLDECAAAFASAALSSERLEIVHLTEEPPRTVADLARELPDTRPLRVPSIFVGALMAVSPFAGALFKLGIKVPGLLLWPRVEARYPLATAKACRSQGQDLR